MKKGFTLIELMVSITIMMLLIGIGTVALNSFNARQKVEATKGELISNLKLARNYATTMQLPDGVNGNLKYVQVDLASDGKINVVTDVGGTYFSKDISPVGVNIGITYPVDNNYIRFASYKGNSLAGDITININTDEDASYSKKILINSSGLINEE